jgi:hypothetical protein
MIRKKNHQNIRRLVRRVFPTEAIQQIPSPGKEQKEIHCSLRRVVEGWQDELIKSS